MEELISEELKNDSFALRYILEAYTICEEIGSFEYLVEIVAKIRNIRGEN